MKEYLNLLPGAGGVGPRRGFIYYIGLSLAVYLAVVLSFTGYNQYMAQRLEKEAATLAAKKSELERRLASLQAPRPEPEAPSFLGQVINMLNQTPRWGTAFSELTVAVPEGVWLNSLRSSDASGAGVTFEVQGVARSQRDMARLIADLDDSPYFERIEILTASSGGSNINFHMRFRAIWQ